MPGSQLRWWVRIIAALSLATGSATATAQPEVRGCPPNWNHDADLNSQDFFDFLADFFEERADYNGDGITNSQDFFDFLQDFFTGCPDPIVVGVQPDGGRPGDRVVITGAGFGTSIDDLCVVVKQGELSIPLTPIEVRDDRIVAVVGAVHGPPLVEGRIMVGRGRGMRGFFDPIFDDIEQIEPTWTWDRRNGLFDLGPPFEALPVEPRPGQRWFFSGAPQDGVLCLVLDRPWPPNSEIVVSARAHNHQTGIGADLTSFRIRLVGPGGDAFQCALRICDIIRCAFLQQAGIVVECNVVATPTGPKVVLTFPGGVPVDWGNLDVCIITHGIQINQVIPPTFTTGDVVRIIGGGFGNNPDDLCVVVMNGDRSISLQALTATENEITAEVGPIPEDAVAGPIMVGLGDGERGTFTPVFPDVEVVQPVWVWDRLGGPAGLGPTVLPVPPTGQQWFFSGPPTNGELRLLLDCPWPPNARIRVQARAHNHASGVGHDLTAFEILLRGPGGDPLACALRICDVIRCAFLQQAGIDIRCEVVVTPQGPVIVLTFPDGTPVDWGNLDVCLFPTPGPLINQVIPAEFTTGDIVRITGAGFGTNPDNLCVVVMNGDLSIPLQAIQATPTEILAEVGAIPPDAEPGPIMVGLGTGERGFFDPAFDDVVVEEPVWVWDRRNQGATLGPVVIPIPPPAPTPVWFFSGPPANGQLRLLLDRPWPPNAIITVSARAHNHRCGVGHDLTAFRIRLVGPGGDPFQCALRICDVITCAFLQQANIVVVCNVINTPLGPVIVLSFPNGVPIDWGNLNVCVQAGPGLRIDNVDPPEFTTGDLVMITGAGFGTNPDNLCAVVMNGGQSIGLQVVAAADDFIVAEVGPIPTSAVAGPIMVGLGEGARGTFIPVFPDVVVEAPVWVWDRQNRPAVLGPVVVPRPPPPPVPAWFFSGPPQNGELRLLLNVPWPPNALIRVQARSHNHDNGVGHDLTAFRIRLLGPGGDPLACAERICDVIRCAFLQQAGIVVECRVEITPAGPVVVITFPDGSSIDWGNLDVCILPG